MLPDSVEPDWVIWLATITTRYPGMVAGGPELLPGSDVHVCQPPAFPMTPRFEGALSTYPFIDPGALFTPLNWFVFHSCDPQKFTWLPLLCEV